MCPPHTAATHRLPARVPLRLEPAPGHLTAVVSEDLPLLGWLSIKNEMI